MKVIISGMNNGKLVVTLVCLCLVAADDCDDWVC